MQAKLYARWKWILVAVAAMGLVLPLSLISYYHANPSYRGRPVFSYWASHINDDDPRMRNEVVKALESALKRGSHGARTRAIRVLAYSVPESRARNELREALEGL